MTTTDVAAILFADLVGSTELRSTLGDDVAESQLLLER